VKGGEQGYYSSYMKLLFFSLIFHFSIIDKHIRLNWLLCDVLDESYYLDKYH